MTRDSAMSVHTIEDDLGMVHVNDIENNGVSYEQSDGYWDELGRLRASNKLVIMLFLMLWIISITWHWEFGLVYMCLVLPAVIALLSWWNRNRGYCPLDHIITAFCHGFFVLFSIVAITLFFDLIIFFSFLGIMESMTGTKEFLLVVFGFLTLSYVAIEEAWKVIFAKRSRSKLGSREGLETKAHLLAATASSVGYATAQNLFIVCIVTLSMQAKNERDNEMASLRGHSQPKGDGISLGWLYFFAAIFSIFSTPLHTLSGYLIGLEVTRDSSCANTLFYPLLVRWIYFYQFFFWPIIFISTTGILALSPMFLDIVGMIGCIYLLVKRIKVVESKLPFEYLQRVGNLQQMFGFSLLATQDPDDQELEMH